MEVVTASAKLEIPSAGISQNVNGDGIPIEVLSETEYKKLDQTLRRKAGIATSHTFPDGVIVMKVYGRELLPVKIKFDEQAVGIKFNEIVKFPIGRKKKNLYDFALCVGIVSNFYSQPRDRKVIPDFEEDPQYPGYYKEEKPSYNETDPRVCFVPINSSNGVIFWEWKNTPGNFKKKGFVKIRTSVTPAE